MNYAKRRAIGYVLDKVERKITKLEYDKRELDKQVLQVGKDLERARAEHEELEAILTPAELQDRFILQCKLDPTDGRHEMSQEERRARRLTAKASWED